MQPDSIHHATARSGGRASQRRLSRLAALFVLLLPGVALGQPSAPFQISNRSPLVQIFGLPAAEGTRLAPAGDTEARLLLDVASHFETASEKGETLVLDGESHRYTLALRRGLGRRLEVGLDLPWLAHRGGSLDGFVEGFHQTFGLDADWRSRAPRDRLLFRYVRHGREELRLDHSVSGLGDLRLTGAWRLREEDAPGALTLRGSLKLPTGDSDRLLGSGSTDLALALAAAKEWPVAGRLGLHGSAGLLLLSRGEVLAERQRRAVAFGSLALGWLPGKRLTYRLQLDAHSPFYRGSALGELTDPALQGTVGAAVRLAERVSLELAVIEELIWNTSPDVTFHLALNSRF
jgi:hypothetical protein